MLSEISHTEKVRNHLISIILRYKIGKKWEATNKQRKNKQKHIDMDNSMVILRGKRVERVITGEGGQIHGDGRWFDFGGYTI